MQQQQCRDASRDAESEQRVFCGVELCGLSDHLRVVAQRECEPFHPLLDLVDHLVQRAAGDVGADIDAAGLLGPLDGVRRWAHLDGGHILEQNLAPGRGVQLHVLHVGDAVACGWDQCDVDVVCPAFREDVTDFLAGD